MAVAAEEWLELTQREYLSRFVPGGGSAVKFIVADDATLATTGREIEAATRERQLRFVPVDAAQTKLHMIQDVFFAIARTIDWNALAQRWVEALLEEERYEWPRPGQAVPLQEIADYNRSDGKLLRKHVEQWLTARIIRDPGMAQDFRYAVTHLCMRQLELTDERAAPPVIEWLRGELRGVGAVRQVPIGAKITRHNGRAMLRSLCRWLKLCGEPGIVLVLDIRQLGRAGAAAGDGIRYTAGAVLDAFEVLRQLIDDIESFGGLFAVVMAGESLVRQDEPKRSLAAYTALKERVWADVHAKGHENPLAPLLQLVAVPSSYGTRAGSGEGVFSEQRVAVEALRAGVPNRAAIRRLGTSDAQLCERFEAQLRAVRLGLAENRTVDGEIVAGGFGSGKSHLLGYLKELALQENFIVSQIAISKETPLFDIDRIFSAAIRNATVPGVNDDVITAAMSRLQPGPIGDLEKWASRGGLAIFAALLFLLPKQATGLDQLSAMARFLSGGKLSLVNLRSWLRSAGALKLFPVKPEKAADLALQRLQITPRLFAAAGFSGWCVLIDEVELIGRYSVLQRGRSYAEMCRWLSWSPHVAVPGLLGLCAISDDFKDVMFHSRLDQEKVPRALRAKRLDAAAELAELAMSIMETRQHFLPAPNEEMLFRSLAKVHGLYEEAYGKDVPIGELGDRRGSKSMRYYIKSWMTGWDLQRLYRISDTITAEEIKSDYTENRDLEAAVEEDAAEENAA